MEAILNKYEIGTKEEFFDGILTSLQIGAKQMAKDMFDELNTDEMKQDFREWFETFVYYDVDATQEGENYEALVEAINAPITNN